MGAFEEDEITRVVKALKDVRSMALIPVGVPNEAPLVQGGRGIGEVIDKETFLMHLFWGYIRAIFA